jgi:hypothetical protein
MQHAMVMGAQEDAVVEVGVAAVGPLFSGVVRDAPGRWSITPWEHAALVA